MNPVRFKLAHSLQMRPIRLAVKEPEPMEPEPEPVPLPQAMAEKVKELPTSEGSGRAKSKKGSKAVLERLMKGHGIRIMQ